AFAQLPRPISCTRPDCHIANTASTCDLCEVGEFSQQICKACKDSVYCHWPTGSTLTADETDVTPTPHASQGVHGWPQDTWPRAASRRGVAHARRVSSGRRRSRERGRRPLTSRVLVERCEVFGVGATFVAADREARLIAAVTEAREDP